MRGRTAKSRQSERTKGTVFTTMPFEASSSEGEVVPEEDSKTLDYIPEFYHLLHRNI